jgi:hypothetical protein
MKYASRWEKVPTAEPKVEIMLTYFFKDQRDILLNLLFQTNECNKYLVVWSIIT